MPPISITGFDAKGYEHIVVTDAFKSSLETANLSGLRFLPVVKRRIVHLDWHTWDQTAEQPAEYPESHEPEDYILLRPHDQEIADQMGILWEVCLEEHARTGRTKMGSEAWDEGIYLLRGSWDGTDWFRASGVGYTYVSENAHLWLKSNAGQWTTVEPACIR